MTAATSLEGSATVPERSDPVLDELTALVPAMRALDEAALTRTYELTADLLGSIALGVVRDRGTAEEVVQETFVRFVQSVGDLRADDGRAVRAWLVRTARNLGIDRTRAASWQREDAVERLPDLDRSPAAEEEATAEVLDPAMQAALEQLTEDQRTAIVLRYVVGMSGAEIGSVLERNRAAVYTLLRRAERRLRNLLAHPFDPDATDRPQHDRSPSDRHD